MSDRAPVYLDSVFHFDALHLAALREGDRIDGTLVTEYDVGCIIRAPAHAHAAHAALCCWGKLSAHSQPALRTGLTVPA